MVIVVLPKLSRRLGDGQASMPMGWFWWAQAHEMLVCRWDPQEEVLQFVTAGEELARLRDRLLELDRGLGPFPYEGVQWRQVERFRQLTVHIGRPLLDQLLIRSPPTTLLSATSSIRPSGSDNDKSGGGELALRMTSLPSEGDLARLNPAYIQDRTPAMAQFRLDPWRLLGEMQACFVLLLLLHNYEAFEHWRDVLRLLCHCPQLIQAEPHLYVALVATLAEQFAELPPDLFLEGGGPTSTDRGTNRLLRWLQMLHEDCVQLAHPPAGLLEACRHLAAVVHRQFGWDLRSPMEEPEEAPVIVQM